MAIVEINYWAVLVAAIVSYILGALWHSPLLFGKLWMRLSKVQDTEETKKHMAKSYILTFLTVLVMSYVLAHFVDYAEATTLVGGLLAGFWAWLGFVATIELGAVLWENKPFGLYLFGASYHLVSLLLMGAILAVWP
ncbi:DUF1761 domain-containing protein [Candidatus Woesearchaeota archaeon]|nr:DUF1761 domain-containing protein [Candidatus Woesearchaeota archaeon]